MRSKRIVCVTLLTALVLCADLRELKIVRGWAQEKPDQIVGSVKPRELHVETLAKLREFLKATNRDGISNEDLLKSLNALNARVDDEHLPTVEVFALTDEAKPIAWAFARLLVERKRYDGAAAVFVTTLLDQENREYRMWKWWDYNFGERQDYKQLSRKITDSLLRQFDKGGADRKLVVAELFGKGEAEAKLTVEEFKRLIGYDDKN